MYRSEQLDDLYEELLDERFGEVFETSPVVCYRCGNAIIKDSRDRWVHVYQGCSQAQPFSTEISA